MDIVEFLRSVEWMCHSNMRGLMENDRPHEAADEIERLRQQNAKLMEALTPSGETKAAYIGEFGFKREGYLSEILVPWTTIKEIMAAIRARAAIAKATGDE